MQVTSRHPFVEVFHGATDLRTHDYLHIVLGRGLFAKDEALVIGFTMGATDQVGRGEEFLYGLFSKYLYPRAYYGIEKRRYPGNESQRLLD